MRLVSIHQCYAGMIIAKSIYNERGLTLVAKGTVLTNRAIESLKKRGISFLYIEDEKLKDLEIEENIPVELRIEMMSAISDVYQFIYSNENKNSKAYNGIPVAKLERALKNLLSELRSKNNVINLLTDIFSHDSYTFSHSANVTMYTLAMSLHLGLNKKQLTEIGIGSMLHDIGKREIPKEILNKKGKLTPDEYEIIKKHTEYGFQILRKDPSISLLSAHCAFQHHEKLDGTGYPRGLKDDEIHPYGKILAVADVFDALTSVRPYRNAMFPQEAMEVILAETNTHFDPVYVKAFQQTVATYPVGLTVTLNTGETAVVVDYQVSAPNRPVVRVLTDPKGNPLRHPYDLDLAKHPSIIITQSAMTK